MSDWSLPAGVSTLPGEEAYYCPICGVADFDGVMDDSWPEDLPGQDEYCSIACGQAAQAGYKKELKFNAETGDWNQTGAWVEIEGGRLAVDAYEHISWSVGTADDFICFDHCRIGERMVLQAVVNSETGSFIDTFEYYEVPVQDALDTVDGMIDRALRWCYDVELKRFTGKRSMANWRKEVKRAIQEPAFD